ncbi:hypothetical protein [Alteromonas macleodii]|jgi:hypothetical protein|uniref:hypothetical protein n=1 Tax=Alteromonas macleodii TaxID=28108 RepID=UPI0019308C91|nr:hypothetical protein [Alteromonas macleodii]|tara:strand:- start:33 stop:569 length:537 start_codon:yes stop_codon:yes gene_type:complete
MKTRLISLATLLCAFGAFNAHAETVADAMEKCRNTDNSLKRLICYDNIAKSLNQYDGTSAQVSQLQAYRSEAATQPRPQVEANRQPEASEPKNDFGLEHRRDLSAEASEVSLTIASFKDSLRGKKIITFSDGSVWQQSDSAYLKIEEGQQVSIERGLLGSFYLSVEGVNKRMKVKRVK